VRRAKSALLTGLCWLAIAMAMGALLWIVVYIFANGTPYINWEILFGPYSSDNPSMRFAIVTTIVLVFLSLLIAGPLGLGCAVYLCEYAKKGRRLVRIIRLATETLAGIPSIIYGLFGALFFGTALHMGYSLLAGILTVSIMILPTIIRTSEEAILSVPDLYREGSYGLGAGKLRTVMRIVLPAASRGILSAMVLSTGRIIGETAALLFTLGSVAKMPQTLMDSSRTLAVHMYISTRDGGMEGRNVAFVAGVTLLVLVTVINLLTKYFSKKVGKFGEN